MIETLILLVLMVTTAILFAIPVLQRIRIIKSTKGTLVVDRIGDRVSRWIGEVIFQRHVISQRPVVGLLHAFVFWGFMAFMLATTDHFCRGFGFTILGNGAFMDWYSLVVAAFAAMVIVGITGLFVRRFIIRPVGLGKKLSWESGVVALFIEILMITYLLAVFVDDLHVTTLGLAGTAAKANWWLHTVTILAFLVLIPRSKHLHLIFGLFATFLKDFELAPLKPLDFENEEFGAENLKDLGPYTALGSFTCVECGRCRDHCPATTSEKTLNPKKVILDLKEHYLEKPDAVVAGEALDPKVIWQCTTCGACTYQCPVGIEHVTPIIETRRGLVAGGEFPQPMTTAFKNLERQKNPWGYAPSEAHEFLKDNKYPEFEGQDVLYWMGCFARFDDRYRKASLAFKAKLEAAGVGFGVLYNEACTGDGARRAGNEFLFMELAMENIAVLNEAKPKTIVSTCPHCVRTLCEYRTLDEPLEGGARIVHHSAFLRELQAQGKLRKPEGGDGGGNGGKVVFHDACYLSRYQAGATAEDPRAYLRARGVSITEAKRKGVQSFCCGAGGAQFFSEEDEGERIYRLRTDELLKTGAKTIVTACPFCQAMLRDGIGDKGIEDVEVKDLSQM